MANLSLKQLPVQRRQLLGVGEAVPEDKLEEMGLTDHRQHFSKEKLAWKLSHLTAEYAEVIQALLWKYWCGFSTGPRRLQVRSSAPHTDGRCLAHCQETLPRPMPPKASSNV